MFCRTSPETPKTALLRCLTLGLGRLPHTSSSGCRQHLKSWVCRAERMLQLRGLMTNKLPKVIHPPGRSDAMQYVDVGF